MATAERASNANGCPNAMLRVVAFAHAVYGGRLICGGGVLLGIYRDRDPRYCGECPTKRAGQASRLKVRASGARPCVHASVAEVRAMLAPLSMGGLVVAHSFVANGSPQAQR